MFTLGAIVSLVKDVLPAADIEIGPGILPETDIQPVMSLAAAEPDLGWRPKTTRAEGLDGYRRWLRTNAF